MTAHVKLGQLVANSMNKTLRSTNPGVDKILNDKDDKSLEEGLISMSNPFRQTYNQSYSRYIA